MTKEVDRYKHSRRIHRKLAHIDRQMGIRQAHNFPGINTGKVDSSHRYHKRSGVTCGSSTCAWCGNPRKFFKELTMQEKRQQQDVERTRNKHSNGTVPTDE